MSRAVAKLFGALVVVIERPSRDFVELVRVDGVAWHGGRLRPNGYVDLNPIRACVPSQKGLVELPPQRHNFAAVTRETTRPVPLVISRLPRTDKGPLSCGSMASTPLRTASASVLPLAGSPVALNPTSWCELSQNGLFFEAPHRHRVARKPMGSPSSSSWPR